MTNDRKRLLVVTSTWPLSAADSRAPFVRDLTLDLAARGWSIEVLAPHAAGAARHESDGPLKIHRFRYMIPERWQTLAYGGGGLVNFRSPVRKLQALPFVLAEVLAVRRTIERFRPHAIHAHWLLPQGFSAWLGAWNSGIPIVTTIHGGDVFGLRSPLFRIFKRLAARGADAITTNGLLTQARAIDLGANPEKLEIIRMAPSFEEKIDPVMVAIWRRRFPQEAKIVLFVGRLVPEKGSEEFIEVIKQLDRPDVFGVICGEGPLRGRLNEIIDKQNLHARITLEGWIDPAGIACRMSGADALLFPSKRSVDGWVEAQGVVLVEAMRAGLPIFAAESGGIPDLIEHGITGWLFPEGDVTSMTALITAYVEGRLADVDKVTRNARTIAHTSITRATSANAFHRLLSRVATESTPDRESRIPADPAGKLFRKLYSFASGRRFRSSPEYWEDRYRQGGSSGPGSYGRLAAFKAAVLNDFVSNQAIRDVIELGCGDGSQLALARYPQYLGVDVSAAAIASCREKFVADRSKSFVTLEQFRNDRPVAELSLSLDVIYHLVEDQTFDAHMRDLFGAATRFVGVYSSNSDRLFDPAPHVRHRRFTNWIERFRSGWHLLEVHKNPFPFKWHDRTNTSRSDLYFFSSKPPGAI